jgi:DtxR family Mn-dependent transcriptional regulator
MEILRLKMEFAWIAYHKLSNCFAGEKVKIAAVIHTSTEFLKFPNSQKIRLGTKIKIRSVDSFDGSILITYDNRPQETLNHTVCERLFVE